MSVIGTIEQRRATLDARFPRWVDLTLHEALDLAATDFGSRPFVITDDRSWTYAEIMAWSERLAQGLQGMGVSAGEKVAIVLANYVEFIALKFAISRIGAVAVPINILNRRDELRYVLDQSDSVLLVTMDSFRGNDYLGALDEIAPNWVRNGGAAALPKLRKVVVLPTGEASPRLDAETFSCIEEHSYIEEQRSGSMPTTHVDPQAICDIIYTSGTTGLPKGVEITHDMLTRTAFGAAYARAFEDGHRIIFSLPMFHVFGYLEGLLAVLWAGGAIVPQLRFDPHATLIGIARHRATDALLIPAMSLAMIDALQNDRYDLSSLYFALASGGRAPERLWTEIYEKFGVSEITTGYGMTETTATAVITSPDDPIERLLTTNGRPRDVGPVGDPALDGRLVAYRVLDPETGMQLSAGETGELVAMGPGVTTGYYKKPEATAAAFTGDGWFRTGDLGRLDEAGYLTLVGRIKESYRCGGEQVLPTEIEDILGTDTSVLQAHVVPIPDERMGEVGVAFIVPRPGATIDIDQLRAATTKGLARFKIPRHFLIVSAADIPTTASGRAQKFILAQRALEILGIS